MNEKSLGERDTKAWLSLMMNAGNKTQGIRRGYFRSRGFGLMKERTRSVIFLFCKGLMVLGCITVAP